MAKHELIIIESIDLNSSLLTNNNILSNEIYEENDIDHGDTNFDIDELLGNHNFDWIIYLFNCFYGFNNFY